jgi:hypothetical protein
MARSPALIGVCVLALAYSANAGLDGDFGWEGMAMMKDLNTG